MSDYSPQKFNKDELTLEPDQAFVNQSGWGFFSEEISWFLFDFFCNRLEPEEKLIFYSYYVTGMTMEEIAERCYSNKQMKNIEKDLDEDNVEGYHVSFQAIDHKINKINKKLKHSWQYSDRW